MTLPKTITIATEDKTVFQITVSRLPKNANGQQITGVLDEEAKRIKIHSKLDDKAQSVALIRMLEELGRLPAYADTLAPTLLDSLYTIEWYNSGRPAAVAAKPSKDSTKTQMLDMGDDIKMIKRVGH
mgnify:CR=1 FL=1